MNSNQLQEENFIEWTTFIIDRVNVWKRDLNSDIKDKIDWTPESLEMIQNYLRKNFNESDFQNSELSKQIDAIVSYVGGVFQREIPETTWKIELIDRTNIFYKLPYLVFKLGAPMCPHKLVQETVYRKDHDVITRRFAICIKNYQKYKDFVNRGEN